MTTDYKVTELFYIIDEFCKHFEAENAGNLLEDNSGVKRRRRAASLSKCKITKCFYKITPCCKSTAGRSVYILTNKCYYLASVIARKV